MKGKPKQKYPQYLCIEECRVNYETVLTGVAAYVYIKPSFTLTRHIPPPLRCSGLIQWPDETRLSCHWSSFYGE